MNEVLRALTEAHEEIGRLKSVVSEKCNLIKLLENNNKNLQLRCSIVESSQKSDEKTYHITLCDFSLDSKDSVIKWVQDQLQCGSTIAKELVELVESKKEPITVRYGYTHAQALEAKDKFFECCGGKILIIEDK